MPSRRQERVNGRIVQEVSAALRNLKDADLGFVTITRAEVSPDLKNARVYYSVLGDEEQAAKTQHALERAAGHIRREVAPALQIRYTPELRFLYDRRIETTDRITHLIEEARASDPNPGPAPDERADVGTERQAEAPSERVYPGTVERLRSPERLERMDLPDIVTKTLAGLEASSLLDVGCGSGVFAEAFAERGLAVGGVDINPAMLEAARAHVPTGDFREAGMDNLPFENDAFDIVFFGFAFHEADDRARALSEAGHVARQRIAILEFRKVEEDFGPPLDHRISEEEMHEYAREAGAGQVETVATGNLILYRITP